jgi:putative oxidoreductase
MSIRSIDTTFDRMASSTQSIAWAMLRILSGLMFAVGHGYGKMFGERAQAFLGGMDFFGIDVGINMLWIAGVIEFFGGILLALGLFTRWTALLSAILMVMAYLAAHWAWFPTLNNGELAALYFVVFFAIFAYGPGRLSLDAIIFKKR